MPDTLKSNRLLYSSQEVADMLDVSVRTIRKLARSGDIRFISIGNHRRFAMTDIEDFIDKNRTPTPVAGKRLIRKRSRPFDVYDFEKMVDVFEGRGKRPVSKS
jgi:excisionase family DNA binding protein